MRTKFFAVCFALLAAAVASSQIISPVTFKMDTPFVVGNTTLPAGSYEIVPTDEEGVLELRGASGSPGVLFDTVSIENVTPFKQTEILFHRYGNNLVLKSVMVAGETTGATSVTSHLERRHAKAFGKPTKVSRPAMKKK
jgi:hypothetical protein